MYDSFTQQNMWIKGQGLKPQNCHLKTKCPIWWLKTKHWFITLFILAQKCRFDLWHKGRPLWNQESKRHCSPQTLSPGDSRANGITVETLHYKRKATGGKTWKGRGNRKVNWLLTRWVSFIGEILQAQGGNLFGLDVQQEMPWMFSDMKMLCIVS